MRNFVAAFIVLFTMAGTAFSETKGPPKKLSADLGGGVKMELVLIPAGEFKMGSGESAEDTAAFFNKTYGTDLPIGQCCTDEHPRHRVRITKPFYLGVCHVTRGQFRQFVAATAYKTDAEKGEEPGHRAGFITTRGSGSTRNIHGGMRVSSRPTNTRW